MKMNQRVVLTGIFLLLVVGTAVWAIGSVGVGLSGKDAMIVLFALHGLLILLLEILSFVVVYRETKMLEKEKTDFVTKMSHDIRTPINGIIGMTDIAMKNADDPERVRDCLSKIDDSSQHLLSLVNDVLDMSAIKNGKASAEQEPFNIVALADECSSIIQGQLIGRQIEFIRDYDRIQHPWLIGDTLHLKDIIINILANSVKFTNDGGQIAFRIKELSEDGETAAFQFEFSDTGIGMSREFLPKLFDAFSQEEDQSRTNYKGTGLGMAITKEYVNLLHGTINVQSKLHEGTRFVVDMPISIDHDPESHAGRIQGTDSLLGKNILLVEDNAINAEIATEILKEAGANVTAVQNGKMAVDTYAQSEKAQFDLIVMDIMMPEMDGLTATKTIRKMNRPDARTIPIIAMTANAFEEDRKTALEAGMNAHIAKPINVKILMNTLDTLLQKSDRTA